MNSVNQLNAYNSSRSQLPLIHSKLRENQNQSKIDTSGSEKDDHYKNPTIRIKGQLVPK